MAPIEETSGILLDFIVNLKPHYLNILYISLSTLEVIVVSSEFEPFYAITRVYFVLIFK